ncbi:MAG: hypothetical protein K6U11_05820 [bacterium]|nr:hypothetical protein [bacterium]
MLGGRLTLPVGWTPLAGLAQLMPGKSVRTAKFLAHLALGALFSLRGSHLARLATFGG